MSQSPPPPPPGEDQPSTDSLAGVPADPPDLAADASEFPSLEHEIQLPPEEPTAVRPAPPARRGPHDFATRGLVLLWCMWLLGSWFMTMRIKPTLPRIRLMVLAAAIGLFVLWPLLRLSQQVLRYRWSDPRSEGGPAVLRAHPAGHGPSAGTIFADWVSLMAVFQAVLWPLPLTTGWSVEQALWLDAAMAAWSFLIAAIVALGCAADGAFRRTLAMLIVLLLLVGEPLVMWLINLNAPRSGGLTWTLRISPLQAIWEMTGHPVSWDAGPWSERVIAVACAAVLAWGIALIARRRGEA